MIVVDTNVIVYLCIGGDQALLAEDVLTTDSDWHAPLLWRSEFRNVVAGFLRRGTLDSEMALRIISEAEVLLSDREHLVDSRGRTSVKPVGFVERRSCEDTGVMPRPSSSRPR